MTQWVRALGTNSGNLNSVPEIHMMEEDNQLQQAASDLRKHKISILLLRHPSLLLEPTGGFLRSEVVQTS